MIPTYKKYIDICSDNSQDFNSFMVKGVLEREDDFFIYQALAET